MKKSNPTKTARKPKKARSKKLLPIDYLRIGRAIGEHGYCGECSGCVCYRDFCDYADWLREHDAERDKR